jgi:hypothetical protein
VGPQKRIQTAEFHDVIFRIEAVPWKGRRKKVNRR